MIEFKLPSLGAEMEAGTLIEWKVKPGDQVRRGDVVAVVETEKAVIDVEIWQAGTVDRIVVAPGQKVPVGALLALLRAEGEAASEAPAGLPTPAPAVAAPKPSAPPAIRVERPGGERVRVTPVARRLAEKLGVDLATVRGTGPEGAIRREDIEQAAAAAPPTAAVPEPAGADRQAAMRRAIAAAMAKSKREIPHYYLSLDIEMREAMTWLGEQNLSRPVAERLLPAALLLRAVALAARKVPEMNGFWVDGAFRASEAVHAGVAISLRQGGLIAPAILDVDKKSLDEVMRDLRDLVNRARTLSLRSSEVTDATITVSSIGERGADALFGVIYPPQVALVGFGAIAQRPWVTAVGGLAARPVITATLSGDHRASDGHRGALFLDAIARLLQEPAKL